MPSGTSTVVDAVSVRPMRRSCHLRAEAVVGSNWIETIQKHLIPNVGDGRALDLAN
jgi:hypothetical protein